MFFSFQVTDWKSSSNVFEYVIRHRHFVVVNFNNLLKNRLTRFLAHLSRTN